MDLALPPANMSACPNPLTVSNTTCAAIALDYSVPLANLPALNYIDVDGGLSVRLPALPQEPHQHRPVGTCRLREEIHHVLYGLAVDFL